MFFRTPRFIRRWFRSRMNPMAENKAWSVKEKLSVLYMLLAWNAVGLVAYQLSKGNKHWPVTSGAISADEQSLSRPAYQWAQTLGIKKAEVYVISKSGIGEKELIELPDENSKVKNTN